MRLYKRGKRRFYTMIVSAIAFVAAIFFILSVTAGAGERVLEEQMATLENAIRRATATCYALEGRYPSAADFIQRLTEDYGLVIDEDKYVIRYDALGKNIMPSISVIPIGGGEDAFY